MDFAYDHITEEAIKSEKNANANNGDKQAEQSTLNADFQEAYKAISSSPWGMKLGGFLGNVVKQGESVYKEAQQELTAVGEDATKGLADLRTSIISRTRGMSLAQRQAAGSSSQATDKSAADGGVTPTADKTGAEVPEESVLERLRVEAAKRLKDLQRAEDAADEALLQFGLNVRNFLRDAVTIAPPSTESGEGSTVLFESKDAQGKRVFHSTRFDAQMHVIHTSLDSFLKDPESAEFESWSKDFDVEKKTEGISKDLEDYAELRASMEKLVPDRVKYDEFWKRYYFLRHSIETAEARRKDLLKAASAEEEVGWDEDSDDDEAKPKDALGRSASVGSSTTIHPPSSNNNLKPTESRKSNDEKSQADSDTSYDMVGAASGAPSHAPNSPKEAAKKDEDSDDDWE